MLSCVRNLSYTGGICKEFLCIYCIHLDFVVMKCNSILFSSFITCIDIISVQSVKGMSYLLLMGVGLQIGCIQSLVF